MMKLISAVGRMLRLEEFHKGRSEINRTVDGNLGMVMGREEGGSSG